jgi:hypothetical protein
MNFTGYSRIDHVDDINLDISMGYVSFIITWAKLSPLYLGVSVTDAQRERVEVIGRRLGQNKSEVLRALIERADQLLLPSSDGPRDEDAAA